MHSAESDMKQSVTIRGSPNHLPDEIHVNFIFPSLSCFSLLFFVCVCVWCEIICLNGNRSSILMVVIVSGSFTSYCKRTQKFALRLISNRHPTLYHLEMISKWIRIIPKKVRFFLFLVKAIKMIWIFGKFDQSVDQSHP